MKEHIKVIAQNECGIEIEGLFVLCDIAANNPECVSLSLRLADFYYESIKESYFDALIEIRTLLEKDRLILKCNGSAIDVYPSPMLRNMGTGRQAYMLQKGVPAKRSQIVDIFSGEESTKYASIKEQADYYLQWLKSLR